MGNQTYVIALSLSLNETQYVCDFEIDHELDAVMFTTSPDQSEAMTFDDPDSSLVRSIVFQIEKLDFEERPFTSVSIVMASDLLAI